MGHGGPSPSGASLNPPQCVIVLLLKIVSSNVFSLPLSGFI